MALQLRTPLLRLVSRCALRGQAHQASGICCSCQHLTTANISYAQPVLMYRQQKNSNQNFIQSRNFYSYFKKLKSPEKIREGDKVESHYELVYTASSVTYVRLGLGGVNFAAGFACFTLGYGALGFSMENTAVLTEQPLQVATFIVFNFMICLGILKVCKLYPLRIYYSEVEDNFVVVFVGVHPFAVRHLKISPGEVKPAPPGQVAAVTVPWSHDLFSSPTQKIYLNAGSFSDKAKRKYVDMLMFIEIYDPRIQQPITALTEDINPMNYSYWLVPFLGTLDQARLMIH
ncbi:hypothetical protein GWK47_019255 [Chionoecetes opilio]|uniref:Uncharacterized protein n=1 Tax=Chionoecetes opilio TaxID=41210 RepID=A0A8J5CFZ5_CHIOP|nr:hypothetical protein GWK47_019255 [Chionoecetes opilio]